MSAQAGILYADARPVPQSTIDLLCYLNADRGPDGTGLRVSPGLAMLSFAFHFDELSTRERQPVDVEDGTLLTWDGRLDNRDDFLVSLSGTARRDHTDAALMAQGVAKWGLRAFERAIGDWSVAHVDPMRREVCLACDYAGNRPVFYCCRPDFVAWSTCLEALAPICGVEGQVDEIFIARFLAYQPLGTHTPYPGITRVPAGTALLLSPGSSPRSFTVGDLIESEIRYRDPRQYDDQYRHLFTEAVRVRLRTSAPVWTELSGGYDSSSVTCVAARLLESCTGLAPGLQPISHVYPESPESDETDYIAAVEHTFGLKSLHVPRTGIASLNPSRSPWLLHGHLSEESSTAEIAASRGGRVLLSGELGDLVSVGARPEDAFFDHLSHGRWTSFFMDSLAYCRGQERRIFTAWGSMAKVLIPALQFDKTSAKSHRRQADYVTQSFGLSPRLTSTALERSPDVPSVSDASRTRRSFVDSMRSMIDATILTAYREAPSLCVSFPFAHRPLVTFILSAPPSVLWRPHHPRAFVCSALADVLPAQILQRGNKGFFPPALTRRLVPLVMDNVDSLDSWRLVQHAYVAPAAVRDIFRHFLDGSQSTAGIVRGLLLAETLIRRLEQSRATGSFVSTSSSGWRFSKGTLAPIH